MINSITEIADTWKILRRKMDEIDAVKLMIPELNTIVNIVYPSVKENQKENNNKYKLCYIKNDSVYFTSREISKQWGDDWNDIPYEHNAGSPYMPSQTDIENNDIWNIYVLKIDSVLKQPCDGTINSQYSVEMINNKIVPWLQSSNNMISIYAGTSLSDFIEMFKINNIGKIYLPYKD